MNHEELSVFIFTQKRQRVLGNEISSDLQIPFHISKLFADSFPDFPGTSFALLSDIKIVLTGPFFCRSVDFVTFLCVVHVAHQ